MVEDLTHPLIRRRDAAQATLDQFIDKPFAWGKFDCAKMVAFHLRALGHDVGLAKVGPYKTALGAKRAIRRFGHNSLIEALDARYPRVVGASALVGDIMALPADSGLGAIAICLGNGRILGFHEDTPGATVLQPVQIEAAWSVDP